MSIVIRLVGTPEKPAPKALVELMDSMDRNTITGSDPFEKGEGYWWIAYDGKTPAGFAGMTLHENGTMAFLCRCGVLPEYRGKGLQRKLIKVRERLAKKIGVKWLVSYTTRKRLVSGNNLIKCGFLLFDPPFSWGDKYWLHFRKEIA